MKDQEIEYYKLKPIFDSAYRNNGNNIKFAIWQVSGLTGISESEITTILRNYIIKLKNSNKN